jgi:hypothetical protein
MISGALSGYFAKIRQDMYTQYHTATGQSTVLCPAAAGKVDMPNAGVYLPVRSATNGLMSPKPTVPSPLMSALMMSQSGYVVA